MIQLYETVSYTFEKFRKPFESILPIYLYSTTQCNTIIQYNTSCDHNTVKHFYLTRMHYSNHIKHYILYYQITAFEQTRDLQGFSARGVAFHFWMECPGSKNAQVHSKIQSPQNLISPSFFPLSHLPPTHIYPPSPPPLPLSQSPLPTSFLPLPPSPSISLSSPSFRDNLVLLSFPHPSLPNFSPQFLPPLHTLLLLKPKLRFNYNRTASSQHLIGPIRFAICQIIISKITH